MACVLVALADERHLADVAAAILPEYQMITLDQMALSEGLPDASIIDLHHWGLVSAWMEHAGGAGMALLLLADVDVLAQLPPVVQERIDDVVSLPLQPTLFQIRLRSLIRMKDRTEQQRLVLKNLAVTNKALESTSDAIVIADHEGVALYVNPAFNRLFGYTVNELNVGGIPGVLFDKPLVGMTIFQMVRQDGSWQGEVELKTHDHYILPFILSVDTIKNEIDGLIGFIAIGTDVSQHKRVNRIQREQRILAEAQLDTAKAITSTLNLNEVFERILEGVSQVVPSDAANIILIQDGNAHLVDRNNYTLKPQIQGLENAHIPVENYDDLRHIMTAGVPLVIPDTKLYLDQHQDMQHRTPWLNSHIGIPIRLQEKIIGFLNVDSIQPGLFTQEHAMRLQLFAEQAAIAIHNARLHERAQQLAMIEERQRLARNLHDAVSQTLFSASLIAEALPQLWERQPEEVPGRLEQIRRLNLGALAEMRTLLLELHPERLLETNIKKLFQQFVDGMLGRTRIDVTLDLSETIQLPSEIHVAAYYITQEALNNVVRHAQANHAAVQLVQDQNRVQLFITDDGCGFDLERVAPTSLGLNNMKERAQTTHAHLEITSDAGKGTRILVTWLL